MDTEPDLNLAILRQLHDDSPMSLAEIKAEIDKLNPGEIAQLKRDLFQGTFEDPAYVAELTRRVDEMEAGRHVVTREALLRRADELGISP